MSFPVPKEYDLPDITYNNGYVIILPLSLSGEGTGVDLSQLEKNLILDLFSKAAYLEDADATYDTLEGLWTTPTRSILYSLTNVTSSNTASNIESGQSYTTTLTASTNYTINSVRVTMGGVDITSTAYSSGTVSIPSVTGNITITATAVLAAQSITATYTQSGTVYDTDTLDSLKPDLVVTANYSGGTSETVPASDYTLSGTLEVGTSTITVSYAGLTTTFTVTVTHEQTYVTNGLFAHWDAIDNQANGTHDSTATTWVDLVNGHTWNAMKNDGTQTWSWDDDALTFSPTGGSGSTSGKNTFKCTRPNVGLRTLEVVFTPNSQIACVGEFTTDLTGITDDTTQIIGVFHADNTATSIGVQSGYQVTDITTIKSISATYNSSYAAVKFYKNSEEITSRGTSHSFKYHGNTDMILGAQNNDSQTFPYGFKGTIHAIRMYNRELTAEEIAQNYAIDVQRFGLS